MRYPLPTTPDAPLRRPPLPLSGVELGLLALAIVTGYVLRDWHLAAVGLTHFDEGVYAFSGMGLAEGARLFPEQQKFSPPVYFSLVALANRLGGAPERSPFLVNLVVGTLTIPVLWGVVRGWFGPVAAVAAAWLLAMSEFHVIMSRTALTDVTFAFTFLVALAAVSWALARGTWWSALVAGVAVGLAWNTKYHGWFALVIGAMVIAGRWQLQGAGQAWFRVAVRQWIVMAVVAAACYAPWSWYIQSQPGSSSGWVSYFATMLRINWPGNLWHQVQQQAYLEGPWSRASVPLAALAAQLVGARHGRGWPRGIVPALAVAAWCVGSAGCAVVLAGLALGRAWREGMDGAAWLLGALVALWFVMAPVYHPYFRLILPFTIATFALTGAAMASWLDVRPLGERALAPLVGAGIVALTGIAALLRRDPSDPWRPTPALIAAADSIDARLAPGEPVSVLGEPALAFYLHRKGHPAFERTTFEGLDTLTAPRLLVAGIYLRHAPRMRARLEERADRLALVGRVPMGRPSDLRLLDDFTPDSARRWMVHPDTTYELLLYKYTPSAGAGR